MAEKSKPIVHIADALVYKAYADVIMSGVVLDYPDEHIVPGCHVLNGQKVYTSPVIRVQGNVVETRRTIYHVVSWFEGDSV